MPVGPLSPSTLPVSPSRPKVEAAPVAPSSAPVPARQAAPTSLATHPVVTTSVLTVGGLAGGAALGWGLSGLAGASEALGFGILLGTPVLLGLAGLALGLYLAGKR